MPYRAAHRAHAPFARRALAVLCAALPLAAAQAQTSGTPTVVVTGTRLPLSAAGLAQNITIIDRQEIEASHVARLEDLLIRTVGVYTDQAGQSGGFVSLYMRGAENSHLLVMLDGVKLNDPTTTRGSAFDLSALDVSQIERIELLRGPASAVYGGEALSGVLHIITRRAAASGFSGIGYAAVGGDGHRKLGGTLSFGQDNLSAQISAGRTEEGDSDSDSKLRLNSVSGSARLAAHEWFNIELFGSHVERNSEAFPDDSGGPRLAVNRQKTLRDSTDEVFGTRLWGGDVRTVRFDAVLSRYDRREHADNAAVDGGVRFPVPAFTSDTEFRRDNATVTATHEYANTAGVVAGFEYQTEKGSLTSVGDFFGVGTLPLTFALDRDTKSAFIEGWVKVLPSLSVQIGVRHDDIEGVDSETTPHLGLVWNLPDGATSLKATYSEGFKPPSFFALGFPIGANPDLRPERSKNAELLLAHRLDDNGSSAQVSLFQTEYEDLVDFDGNTFTNINRGKIVVRGIEPQINMRLTPQWRVQAAATFLNIDVRDGLQQLRNRPEKVASASTWFDFDARNSVFGTVRYVGHFLDRSNPTGDIEMPSFTVFDAGYTFTYGPMRLRLSLDNVFDKYYEQFVGFPAQGRRVRAEIFGSF
ncbi:MAG TPA: TonB-dependent receptor [Burkholderiaceae bacterium]